MRGSRYRRGVQPPGDSSHQARHRARAAGRGRRRERGESYRAIAWQLVKDTTDTCVEYRVTGLAGEVAFFTLMSVPPLLLCIAGTLGYLSESVIQKLEQDILNAANTVLTPQSVHQTVQPLLTSVFSAGRPDLISIGFLLALWSGSRALYVFVDSVTIMYGLEGKRGIVATRLLSLGLYVLALLVGTIVFPLILAGPDTLVHWFPAAGGAVHALYWPGAILLSVVFMTTLYHVAVPVRTAWREDVPGAVAALFVFAVCSVFLRMYLVHSVEGEANVYSSLAAPVAVLLWIALTAMAVLIGAALNAAVDRMWPTRETAEARAENEKAKEEAALEMIRRADARRAAVRNSAAYPPSDDPSADPEAPAEYPERWADFLPPANLRDRVQRRQAMRKRRPYPSPYGPPGEGRPPRTGDGTDAGAGSGATVPGSGSGGGSGRDSGGGGGESGWDGGGGHVTGPGPYGGSGAPGAPQPHTPGGGYPPGYGPAGPTVGGVSVPGGPGGPGGSGGGAGRGGYGGRPEQQPVGQQVWLGSERAAEDAGAWGGEEPPGQTRRSR